ncbi:MAG: hypothetical protein Q7O66_15425 [Dehalococcoidia bacterium]|nr:hypothetical protein [Dehalococcoidia bacterium]
MAVTVGGPAVDVLTTDEVADGRDGLVAVGVAVRKDGIGEAVPAGRRAVAVAVVATAVGVLAGFVVGEGIATTVWATNTGVLVTAGIGEATIVLVMVRVPLTPIVVART